MESAMDWNLPNLHRIIQMSTEDFDSKRSDHPDFMTAHELKQRGFCGVRTNSISEEVEIWKCGEVAKIVRKEMLEMNANAAIANALEDVFLLTDVQIGEG